MNLRHLLGRYLGPQRRAIVLLIVLQAVQTTATLLLPSLNSRLIDQGVLLGDTDVVWRFGGIMLGISILQVAVTAHAMRYAAQAAMGFGRDVRRSIFRRVTEFSAREVGHFGAPSLITRITNDVQQVQTLLVMVGTMMITAPLTMVIGIVFAIREDARLSLLLLVAIPVEVVVLGSIVSRMAPAFQKMQLQIDRVNTVLREQITGVRVVRAFTREPEESRRFGEANTELSDTSMRAARFMAATFPTVTLIVNLSSIAVLWFGADLVASGDTQIGSLVAYLTYLIQIMMAVVMATFMISMIPRAAVAADRIIEVIDTEPSVRPPGHPVAAFVEPGTVEFRSTGFLHPGAQRPVLNDVSFRVSPGETTAVIGSTGSGKTTLITLAARLIDASEGTVLVGGVDVRLLSPGLLWGSIGYVPQRAFLFAGTVASNLRFGRPEAADDELWAALEIAQAAGFVQSMPQGLESPVAQGGTNVSGGQRQRLAIARALVARPSVYLFDDCFSALDLATEARLRAALAPHTEARLRAALAPHTEQAAVIVVAQRISTIESADQILVLEDGELVGRGRHADLLENCATYAEIVDSQRGEAVA